MANPYRTVFGDIHNHNAHGYGVGSIERSVDIARRHLDFFAFTGHSSWHDLGTLEGGAEAHFNRGFERLAQTWPRVQRVIAESNRDGEFCSFLGFEWHSNFYGDQCVVFPDDFQPIHYTDRLHVLRDFCLEKSALMIPHHLAYPKGRRGANWDGFDNACTPVVEIYSWHGNSEDDRGPYPMFKGSPGGRDTRNTVRAALANGMQFGFVASSDNHAGFPGAYGEGLMAALVTDLTRPAILDAIRSRRTYALTGDRIEIDLGVDGAVMGSSIDAGAAVELSYDVRCRDELECVEVVQDGVVVHRSYGREAVPAGEALSGIFQVRLEWGWGPWASLGIDRITDWSFDLHVTGGRIARFFPCLSSGPFDEDRRHEFTRLGDGGVSVRSYTSRKGAFRENPNQSVVLEIEGGPDTEFNVALRQPAEMTVTAKAAALYDASMPTHTGPYPSESLLWHRVLPVGASAIADRRRLELPGRPSYVYLRVKQKNGHMAWTSPVYVNYR